ncbi:MAG TPA: hypothetical protein VE967_15125 [Gemmatimonadaceae bacterium]|nr:hypothetical protein [Gemmatimonadaceae bacterium]
MLINLVPDFLAVTEANDPAAAYDEYLNAYRRLLDPYWRNYVIEPEGPHFHEIVRATVSADRRDLREMLATTDIVKIAAEAEQRCRTWFDVDSDLDVVLMVGVGAANAGELVVDGRGVAFICVEHFTGMQNHSTHGLGLEPELIALWLAHEIAHTVRYTSPASSSEMKALIAESGGNYSFWETGARATLRELLINEGVAVQAARLVSPGHAEWEYFGYGRREFSRIRELEPVLTRVAARELDERGLGLRLRYLSGGMSDISRTVDGVLLPERSGYFLGARMLEGAITEFGLPWALRASAADITRATAALAQIA